MARRDIPGFYFDPERNRYFPLSHRPRKVCPNVTKIAEKNGSSSLFLANRKRRRPSYFQGWREEIIKTHFERTSICNSEENNDEAVPSKSWRFSCVATNDGVTLVALGSRKIQIASISKTGNRNAQKIYSVNQTAYSVSPDGRFVVFSPRFPVWTLASMSQSCESKFDCGVVDAILVDNSQTTVLGSSNVHILDKIDNTSPLSSYCNLKSPIVMLSASCPVPDLRFGFLSGHRSGDAHLWDSRTFKPCVKLRATSIGCVTGLQSPKDEHVIVGKASGEVQLWDVRFSRTFLLRLGETQGILGGQILGQLCISLDGNFVIAKQEEEKLNVFCLTEPDLKQPLISYSFFDYFSSSCGWGEPFILPRCGIDSSDNIAETSLTNCLLRAVCRECDAPWALGSVTDEGFFTTASIQPSVFTRFF